MTAPDWVGGFDLLARREVPDLEQPPLSPVSNRRPSGKMARRGPVILHANRASSLPSPVHHRAFHRLTRKRRGVRRRRRDTGNGASCLSGF